MKKLFLVALTIIGFSAIAHADVEVATGCTYTGDSSDYCCTTVNNQNYYVISCRPGATSCGWY